MRPTQAGLARRNGRFCSPECRGADLRGRRAAARAELRRAVEELGRIAGEELRAAVARIEEALAVLGL